VCRRLAREPRFVRSRSISAYWPVDGELDPRPLITLALKLGKRVYLPVCEPATRRLHFALYHPDRALRRTRHGLHEPHPVRGELIDPRRLDLVIVPLFAFDARGTRLGTGGGYYDRTFSFAASSAAWRRPALIGVGYAFQQHERLERAPWDVPLDGAVTDRGTFRFRPGSRS
jgi:5-formyltetrahydrofolate cyclo-ligase